MILESILKTIYASLLMFVCILNIIYFIHSNTKLRLAVSFFAIVTMLLSTFYLLVFSLNRQRLPFLNLYESLVFLSWALNGIFVLMNYFSQHFFMGIFVFPVITFIFLQAQLYPPFANLPTPYHAYQLIIIGHISVSLLAYGLICYSFLLTLIFNQRFKNIKEKKDSFLSQRLPSLELLEKQINTFIFISCLLLTVGFLLGYQFSKVTQNFSKPIIIKLITSSITILIFSTFLLLKKINKTSKTTYLKLYAFGFLSILITLSLIKN